MTFREIARTEVYFTKEEIEAIEETTRIANTLLRAVEKTKKAYFLNAEGDFIHSDISMTDLVGLLEELDEIVAFIVDK